MAASQVMTSFFGEHTTAVMKKQNIMTIEQTAQLDIVKIYAQVF